MKNSHEANTNTAKPVEFDGIGIRETIEVLP